MSEKVSYKGRMYRRVWAGQTKYGHRSKLEFLDGSKQFFVGSDMVSVVASSSSSSSSLHCRCRQCSRGNESLCERD